MSQELLEHFALLAASEGGVAKLRELILSLAVRGKLVPQDPKDEPASVLLEKIRAEKERLVADGKIKRDKPLAPIGEDERPYELEKGWEWIPLQHLGYTQTGGTPDKKESNHFGTDIPFIKPGDIYPSHVEYDNEGLSLSGADSLGRTAPAGTVLMVCIGTIGKCNLITRTCSFNQQINSVTALVTNPRFALFALQSRYFQHEAWSRSSSTTIAILNKGKWESIPIPLPPLPEQSRIVAKVEALMALCDRLETQQGDAARVQTHWTQAALDQLAESSDADEFARNWQALAEHFDTLFATPASIDALDATLLQLAVRGKLVPQNPADEPANELLKKIRAEKDRLIAEGKIKRDKPLPQIANDEKPFELPKGWEWVRLDSITDIGTGTTPSRANPAYYNPPDIPWVASGETGNPFITKTAESVSSLALKETSLRVYPKHTLIIALYGQGKTRGQISELLIDATTNQACAAIVPMLADPAFKEYIKQFFRKMYEEIREQAAGGAQPNLNVGKIKATLIPLPPLPEQSRIVAKLDDLLALTRTLRTRLADARAVQARLASALVDEVAAC